MSNPTKPSSTGPNRTGIARSPKDSKEAIKSAAEGVPSVSYDAIAHRDEAIKTILIAELAISHGQEPISPLAPVSRPSASLRGDSARGAR